MSQRQRGFTLIELLVVVAVIAILAAIAIPNFLEAQTRAKVSRARADMKTVVTGIEMYRVDNNAYPTYHYSQSGGTSHLEFHLGGSVTAFGQSPPFDGRNPLTTPISYLTSMPQDPFMAQRSGPPQVREYLYVNWAQALRHAAPNEALRAAFLQAQKTYGGYRLHSRGPDKFGPDSGLPYDPTNGTSSAGDITYGPVSGFDKLEQFGS